MFYIHRLILILIGVFTLTLAFVFFEDKTAHVSGIFFISTVLCFIGFIISLMIGKSNKLLEDIRDIVDADFQTREKRDRLKDEGKPPLIY